MYYFFNKTRFYRKFRNYSNNFHTYVLLLSICLKINQETEIIQNSMNCFIMNISSKFHVLTFVCSRVMRKRKKY